MRNILFVIFILIPSILNATHLIGGELTYTCLGGGQYEIKVVIYRDCGPTNTQGTGFDENSNNPNVPSPFITIYDMNNNFYSEIEIGFADVEFVVDQFTNDCVTLPPELCVERGTYTVVVPLPDNANGYQIVYQRSRRYGFFFSSICASIFKLRM